MYTCNICNTTSQHPEYTGKELLHKSKEEFKYFQCNYCQCLQLINPPQNMYKYYGTKYYSFQNEYKSFKKKIADTLLKYAILQRLGFYNPIGTFALLYNPYYKEKHSWLKKITTNKNQNIIDIGCGSGKLIREMYSWGFKNIIGVDPFIEDDIVENNQPPVYKRYISEVKDKFSLVMLHHSLEHMENPHEVFSNLKSILSDKGYIIIRIPVINNYLWRKYQMNWYQIDSPRHIFIHSIESINILARSHDLIIKDIIFDMDYNSIINSERYTREELDHGRKINFSNQQIKQFKRKAKELNLLMDGDQACFILAHKELS